MEAVREQLDIGMTFFANNAAGLELAEAICDAVPCAEQLRYVSTGGEADMYAMRLARAHTGRSKIMKFEGGYHGMSAEALMSLAPSRLQNFPRAVPDSAGIPESVGDGMLVAPFNDSDFAESLIDEHGGEVPADRAALEALPGVGRKTANVVLNEAFGEPTIAVDTHIFRVGNRTGMAPGKTPDAVEAELVRRVPDAWKKGAHHWLILHGRYVCKARKPDCAGCAIHEFCLYKDKTA